MKKNKRKNAFRRTDYLSANQTDKILSQIIADSRADSPKASSQSAFGSRFRTGYFFKTACILCCSLLFLAFFIPGTVTPAPISNVTSASPSTEKTSSLTVNFQINSLVPLQEVTARMNNKPAEVKQESYQGYSVEVRENGYLLIEAETITGKVSSQNILIDSLDTDAPRVVSHARNGNEITIYLSDGDGAGIDYPNISAYESETSAPVLPVSFDETAGCVVFTYPATSVYIEIPDKAGNKVTFLLKPITPDG